MKMCKYAIIKIFETVIALPVQSKNVFTAAEKKYVIVKTN